jgi:hypothetical protein
MANEVDDDFEHDEMLEFMSAKEIDALEWTGDRLKSVHVGGELAHLGERELKTLFDNAWQRDIQRTIIR